jgi:repressor of nif and glnA expression
MHPVKTANIPDAPILRFVEKHGGIGCNWFGNEFERSVTHAMPEGTPRKVVRAKMRKLDKAGLIRGCHCGCRGDYELTEKGKEELLASL